MFVKDEPKAKRQQYEPTEEVIQLYIIRFNDYKIDIFSNTRI